MKIASWNINSIKARLPNVLKWLESAQPEVLLLQELKGISENFPTSEMENLGYNCAINGQKAYNGVAILSKYPMDEINFGLPDYDEDQQARYIEAWVRITDKTGLRIASIYAPNGNPVDSEKFSYKIDWMDHLIDHSKTLLNKEEVVVLGGDYNVIPADEDCYDPIAWQNDALTRPESRSRFRALLNLGYTEAWRSLNKETHVYSFWDYQAGAWHKDNGIRIDHLLLSPQAADKLETCTIDKKPRGQAKASDHTPVWCEISI